MSDSKTTLSAKVETKAEKDWRLARSLGHDDAIMYLVGQAIAAANLSMRCRGERAVEAAVRAFALANAALSISRKRHKLLRLTKGYRDEIQRARLFAAEANLLARSNGKRCPNANAAFQCRRLSGHTGKHEMERVYA